MKEVIKEIGNGRRKRVQRELSYLEMIPLLAQSSLPFYLPMPVELYEGSCPL